MRLPTTTSRTTTTRRLPTQRSSTARARGGTTMPAERRFGMDHEHYDWSPMVKRGALRWPEQARLALCVMVNLEHTEWLPPADSFRPVLAGGVAARPYPDYALLTHREY